MALRHGIRKHRLKIDKNAHFENLLDCIPDALFVIQKGKIVRANREGEGLLKCPFKELHGRSLTAFVNRKTGQILREKFRQMEQKKAASLRFEMKFVPLKKRENIIVQARLDPFKFGGTPSILCAFRDISDQVRIQKKLKDEENHFNSLIDHTAIAYYRVGPDLRLIHANQALADLMGQPLEDCIGRSVKDLIQPDSYNIFEKRMRDHMRGKSLKTVKYRLKRKDGLSLMPESSGRPVFRNGRFLYIEGFTHDISGLKEANQRIQTLVNSLESLQHAVFISDLHGRLTYGNHYFRKHFGYTAQQLTGLEICDLIWHPEFSDQLYIHLIQKSLNRGWRGELTCAGKKKEPFPCHMTISRVLSDSGNLSH